ncbi:unnamed protein product [Mesocestoides corti]|uniref:Secreted protein n=1 Tax=Mesocestoides corti TaxID=53468 RepID=A0A0R3U4K1_MESCO|nr:unnamed protein product [Mesocestoides corti]
MFFATPFCCFALAAYVLDEILWVCRLPPGTVVDVEAWGSGVLGVEKSSHMVRFGGASVGAFVVCTRYFLCNNCCTTRALEIDFSGTFAYPFALAPVHAKPAPLKGEFFWIDNDCFEARPVEVSVLKDAVNSFPLRQTVANEAAVYS